MTTPDTQELTEALENLERYLRDTPHHNAIEAAAARKALSRARSADEQSTPPHDLVEVVARALYACEKERSDRCDAVISAAKGKTVSVGMESWEECWQAFYDDAQAVLQALSPHLSERDKIVAWLRRYETKAEASRYIPEDVPAILANAISRGDHISGEGR